MGIGARGCEFRPRPPLLLPSICVHESRRAVKKQGRPGLIYYISGCEVDIVGRGHYSNKYVCTKKACFLLVKTSSLHYTIQYIV